MLSLKLKRLLVGVLTELGLIIFLGDMILNFLSELISSCNFNSI